MREGQVRVYLWAGLILLGVAWGLGSGVVFWTHPVVAYIGILSLGVGVGLVTVALWNVLDGLLRALFVAGIVMAVMGIVLAILDTPETELVGGSLLGIGILSIFIACIPVWSKLQRIVDGDIED